MKIEQRLFVIHPIGISFEFGVSNRIYFFFKNKKIDSMDQDRKVLLSCAPDPDPSFGALHEVLCGICVIRWIFS